MRIFVRILNLASDLKSEQYSPSTGMTPFSTLMADPAVFIVAFATWVDGWEGLAGKNAKTCRIQSDALKKRSSGAE